MNETVNNPTPEAESDLEGTQQLGLFDHLDELRRRLAYSALAILIAAVICFFSASQLFEILTTPFHKSFAGFPLIGTGPAEAFLLKLKAAFFGGVVLSSPILFIQIWLFISPGLYPEERRLALPFVFFTSLLFFIGVSFAYMIVVPFAFDFFRDEYVSIGVTPTIRISEFLSLTIKVLLGFGAVFETPIIAFFLGRLGVIDHKFLIKYFRHAVVLMFVISAFLTPPDIVTQLLMAGPLVTLYGLSILIVYLTGQKPIEPSEDETLPTQ